MNSKARNEEIRGKIMEGVKKAHQKLLQETAMRDEKIVIFYNGKVRKISPKQFKTSI